MHPGETARFFRSPNRALIFNITLMLVTFISTSSARAQEPSSAGIAPVSSPTGPSAALRDALAAACAHNEKDFARFLTITNQASFARMTDAARVGLMKRLVLLDDAGKPKTAVNPGGRPIVTCETPIGAAEIQLGGAEQEDNLAFVPIDLRDATDSAGTAMHIKVGLIREGREWKLLSLGLVLLDLPALEVEWDTAEISENERAAIAELKSLADAVETYRRTYTRLPESLLQLGPSTAGGPTPNASGLIDAGLASGKKNGYSFRYVIVGGSDLGAPAHYELAATPATYGRTGKRSFFRGTDGKIHAADHQGAVGSQLDPAIE